MAVTARQRRVLDYIKHYFDVHQEAPTIAEIGKEFGMSSSASVHHVVSILEREGLIRRIPNVSRGIEVTIVVQGMAYSMGSVVLQAASPGRRLSYPHSWIMIHEPAKWAGWQSTSAAAQHLDRLKQMQSQIYQILAARSGKPLQKIIRDTKRTDFYLDATKAFDYGLIDGVLDDVMAKTATPGPPMPPRVVS